MRNSSDDRENLAQSREITPGKLLTAAREQQGKSQKDLANDLKISVHRLRSIETDDYSDFPSETYVRGHLKNYGRSVGISEDEIMGVYENCNVPLYSASSNAQRSDETVANSRKHWSFVYMVLVLLALLWFFSYWLFSDRKSQKQEPSQPYSSLGPEPTPQLRESLNLPYRGLESALEEQSYSSAFESEVESSEAQTERFVQNGKLLVSKITAAELVKSIIAEDQASIETEEASTTLVAIGDNLSFSFQNPCWIKITDADGQEIFAGLQQAGTDLSIYGKAPFKIVVGNVDGTSLAYNGEPVK
ncbi:MAG: cytoskeleton protein RodZ, partial [Cellvibrionaceae bacterium]